MKIDDNAKALLAISAADLVKELNENKKAVHVRMKACDHLLDNDELVQIHVLVTRDTDDFIDDFQIEVMNKFKP